MRIDVYKIPTAITDHITIWDTLVQAHIQQQEKLEVLQLMTNHFTNKILKSQY